MVKLIATVLTLACVGGCGLLPSARLYAPENFGLSRVTARIYVEDEADPATRLRLREALERAEVAIRAAFGSVQSTPVIHACITEACYERFGGKGSRAKVYGDQILLSPRGLNWHYIAHEWSHAEIRSRLTANAWWSMPRWFDEGLAVAISEAPENSESHWQFLVAANIPRPTREELRFLRSFGDWDDAVGRYGEKKNAERREKGEQEIRPVYTAAGHALRPWLAQAGTAGLLAFIERLNRGEDLESIYQTVAPAINAESVR